MACKSPNDMHMCPLFNKKIYWSMCYEVQEIRNDDMDIKMFPGQFDIKEADKECINCEWYKSNYTN